MSHPKRFFQRHSEKFKFEDRGKMSRRAAKPQRERDVQEEESEREKVSRGAAERERFPRRREQAEGNGGTHSLARFDVALALCSIAMDARRYP